MPVCVMYLHFCSQSCAETQQTSSVECNGQCKVKNGAGAFVSELTGIEEGNSESFVDEPLDSGEEKKRLTDCLRREGLQW